MKLMKKIALLAALAGLLTCPALAGDVKLETEDQKTIYALGLALAQNLKPFNLSAAELQLVVAGLEAGAQGDESAVSLQEYGPKIGQLQQARAKVMAEKEKTASADFLAKQAAAKGAEVSPSGLIYFELTAGTGESPSGTDTVKVHYHGTLRDGSVFDSSVERGTPATFPLNQVIPCWTEGVAKMKVGGKAKLVCPSDIAYGERGAPPKIGPGAALVFEVELLEIVK